MIQGLKPYPAYKDSGVPWLGEVPGHWGMRRGKWLFKKMSRPIRASDDVVTCFRDGVVTLRKKRRVRGFTESLKEIGYQGIRRGDLVIHAMDAFAGAVGVSDSDGKGSPVYSVCEPRPGAESAYYARLTREMARSQWIQALTKGIRERSTDFRFEAFGSQVLPLPPFPDQSAIVRFLGHVDGKIQRAIRAKQTLIKLLEEQKQVLIHRAVTGQIDVRTGKPYPAYKPSGVEWLGQVPEHWKVVQLRRLISFISSGSRGWARYYSDEGDIFIQSGNLGRSMELDFSFVQHVALPHGAEGLRTRISQGDVLVCVTGALTGNVALVDMGLPVPAYVNQHVALVRPKSAMAFPRYLATVLFSGVGKVQFKISEYGGTKQGLGLDDVKSVILPLPERSEQVLICDKLGVQLAPLTRAVNEAQEAISLLREYRTRLVADVVTGKLDVRETAANLPAEPEAEVEATEPDEDLDLPQAAEDEGSYDGGQEED